MNRTALWESTVGVLGPLCLVCLRVLSQGMEFLLRCLLLFVNRIRMLFTSSTCHVPLIPGQGLFLLLPILTQPIGRILLNLRPLRTQRSKLDNPGKEIRMSREPRRGAATAYAWNRPEEGVNTHEAGA